MISNLYPLFVTSKSAKERTFYFRREDKCFMDFNFLIIWKIEEYI
jgi:hypothetical protein